MPERTAFAGIRRRAPLLRHPSAAVAAALASTELETMDEESGAALDIVMDAHGAQPFASLTIML